MANRQADIQNILCRLVALVVNSKDNRHAGITRRQYSRLTVTNRQLHAGNAISLIVGNTSRCSNCCSTCILAHHKLNRNGILHRTCRISEITAYSNGHCRIFSFCIGQCNHSNIDLVACGNIQCNGIILALDCDITAHCRDIKCTVGLAGEAYVTGLRSSPDVSVALGITCCKNSILGCQICDLFYIPQTSAGLAANGKNTGHHGDDHCQCHKQRKHFFHCFFPPHV